MSGLSAPRRKYVGVSTASNAACFVLVLEAPPRVRLRPASSPSTPLARRNSRSYLRRRALSRRIGSLIAVLLVVTACGADPSDEDVDQGETATTAATTVSSTTSGGLYGGDD